MNNSFNPLVSIVIPVYNGSNYMREAIDSALAQTYKNIEIVVVNDGSRDEGKTDSIAKSYGDRIRYFFKENGGCASALNAGIAQMRGEYFSWLSHDDVYLPGKIERQIEILSTLARKDTVLYSGYEMIDAKSRCIGTLRPDAMLPPDKLNIPLMPLLRGLIHGCTLLIHKKYFDILGRFEENRPHTQDYAMWFKLLRIAPIYFDNQINVRGRLHVEQSTHKIQGQMEECNTLWCGFLRQLTREEILAMADTQYQFLMEAAAFFLCAKYDKAMELAFSMAKNLRGENEPEIAWPPVCAPSLIWWRRAYYHLRKYGIQESLSKLLSMIRFKCTIAAISLKARK